MSKLTIYAGNMNCFKNLVQCFDGSADFVIENPWFALPGVKPADPKTYLNGIPDKKGGLFLNAPRIIAKTTNKTFTSNYVIGWTTDVSNTKIRKEYRIMAPYGSEELKRKQKLMVSPNNKEDDEADRRLKLLNWQFTIAQDVMLIATLLEINLSKYSGTDTKVFLQRFITDVNTELKRRGSKTFMDYDEELAKSFTQPPILSVDKKKNPIFIYDVEAYRDASLEPLMSVFYDIVSELGGNQNWCITGAERIWARPSCFAIPSIRDKVYIRKDTGEVKTGLDSRLTFISRVDPSDKEFNPKFPEGLCTKQQVNKTRKEVLTKATLPHLWGAEKFEKDAPKGQNAVYVGCIFFQPQLSFSYHEKGGPTIDWRVDTLALKRIIIARNDNVDDACEFFDDGDDITAPTTNTQSENNVSDGAEFVGNENEQDPDAL